MKTGDLTKEGFDRLLEWLGKDLEEAARKYEAIRSDLITFFDRSVGAEAEDLADDTINLVIEKLSQIMGSFTGDPRHYFFRVAQLKRLEAIRKLARKGGGPLPADVPDTRLSSEAEEMEHWGDCLRGCLSNLRTPERRAFISYYRSGNRNQLDHRRKLASRLGISLNALRLQIFRLKEKLRVCILSCMENGQGH